MFLILLLKLNIVLGKGKEALELLCQQAKENGLRFLCDDIETNNPAKNLFLIYALKKFGQEKILQC